MILCFNVAMLRPVDSIIQFLSFLQIECPLTQSILCTTRWQRPLKQRMWWSMRMQLSCIALICFQDVVFLLYINEYTILNLFV